MKLEIVFLLLDTSTSFFTEKVCNVKLKSHYKSLFLISTLGWLHKQGYHIGGNINFHTFSETIFSFVTFCVTFTIVILLNELWIINFFSVYYFKRGQGLLKFMFLSYIGIIYDTFTWRLVSLLFFICNHKENNTLCC